MSKTLVYFSRLAVLLLVSGTVAGNFLFSTRDVPMTVGQESFQPSEVVGNRLWTETPIQILHTHMADSTRFVGVGVQGEGGIPFANRLVFNFGPGQVDQRQPPFDLRGLPESELDILKSFVQRLSYRSSQPCPHNPDEHCTFAIGWNRERTKEKDMLMLVVRISDSVYLMVDDSIVNIGAGDK